MLLRCLAENPALGKQPTVHPSILSSAARAFRLPAVKYSEQSLSIYCSRIAESINKPSCHSHKVSSVVLYMYLPLSVSRTWYPVRLSSCSCVQQRSCAYRVYSSNTRAAPFLYKLHAFFRSSRVPFSIFLTYPKSFDSSEAKSNILYI